MTNKRVLVASATGRLGVVLNALLDRGHWVRTMTRDPSSPAAARLRAARAEVVYGDFDDPDRIAGGAAGVDAMFATGTAHRAGPDGELRHARNIARAAAAAGAPHLVYSSGDGAAPDSPLPLFRVKHQVTFTARRIATDALGPGLRSLFAWLEQTGHNVDIPGLHERYPQLGWHTYEEWLRSERPRLAGLCPHEHASVN